jgi:hypothetical protein
MIYRNAARGRTKRPITVEHAVTKAEGSRAPAGMTERQAPIALVGLVAIAVIWVIHTLSAPPLAAPDGRLQGASGCGVCGTVVAVRRSAHSVPQTFVEVKMTDGSLRTVRSPTAAVSVGDVVELRGDGLTPRDVF